MSTSHSALELNWVSTWNTTAMDDRRTEVRSSDQHLGAMVVHEYLPDHEKEMEGLGFQKGLTWKNEMGHSRRAITNYYLVRPRQLNWRAAQQSSGVLWPASDGSNCCASYWGGTIENLLEFIWFRDLAIQTGDITEEQISDNGYGLCYGFGMTPYSNRQAPGDNYVYKDTVFPRSVTIREVLMRKVPFRGTFVTLPAYVNNS